MLTLLLSSFLPSVVAADLIDDAAVRDFVRVLARAAIADRSREHGAFVVRSPEGIVYFVVWPPSGERDLLRWHGRFPEGTIAILHTHAPWAPAPSKIDARTARRARIPVYVITPSRISKTTGEESSVLATGPFDEVVQGPKP